MGEARYYISRRQAGGTPMTLLSGLHGTVALLLFCSFLFAEESGIPLPFAPGEVILVGAGILIAHGELSFWLFVPAACVATLGGSLTAYTWTRKLGSVGLRALAERVHAAKALDRASERLRSAHAPAIALCRSVPGLRIYTSLVAGAVGIELRVFLLGVIPAILVWVVGFTLLGALVGIPVEHFLGRVGKLAFDAAVVIGIGVGGILALRNVPPADRAHNALRNTPGLWRLVIALCIDIGIIGAIVSGITELVRDGGGPADPDGFTDVALIVAAIIVVYVVATRRGIGTTGGERLLNVSYRSPWRHRA